MTDNKTEPPNPSPSSPPIGDTPEELPDRQGRGESISDLAGLFDQCPNPFMRCDKYGGLIYANRIAVSSVLGGPATALPERLLHPCLAAYKTTTSQVFEIARYPSHYQFIMVPDPDNHCVNIHGKEKFSSQHPEANLMRAEILRLEKEKKELATLALHAQKLDAAGTLARGVVIDFGNFLTMINGYSELYLEKAKDADSRSYFMQKIRDISKEAIETFSQLKFFSLKTNRPFKPVNCNQLVKNVLPILKQSVKDTIAVETKLRPGLRPVMGNEELLEQAITNLAINAFHAMQEGGRLTIKTANVKVDKTHCCRNSEAKPGPCVMIAVSDTGISIDSRFLPHLFDPCAPFKREGAGLELPAACVIAKQHKGWMEAESGKEKGTVIRVYLPVEI